MLQCRRTAMRVRYRFRAEGEYQVSGGKNCGDIAILSPKDGAAPRRAVRYSLYRLKQPST